MSAISRIGRELSAEVVRDQLAYNPQTGEFTWKVRKAPHWLIGRPAGSLTNTGYLNICVNGVQMMAHRMAWLYVYGVHPAGVIDHINGCRKDNRIINIRDVEFCTNTQNTRVPRSNNSAKGLLGVSAAASKTSPWRASIKHAGKTRYLGVFKTAEDAHAAYLAEKRRIHPGCTI